MSSHFKRNLTALTTAAFLVTLLMPVTALADRARTGDSDNEGHGRSGILPPGSRAFGASYGEWSARYWQWVLGAPEATNPALDETGASAGYGQSGRVWFLAGTFGNSVERTIDVPEGNAMFLAVHPWIFGAGVFDCEPTVPGVTCDVPTLRAKAADAAGGAVVEVTIDGEPVTGIEQYRAQSPGAFSITLPPGAVFGLEPGTYSPQVSDGYWLLLAPMSKGRHEIVSHVVNAPAGIDMVATLHLNVGEHDDADDLKAGTFSRATEWTGKSDTRPTAPARTSWAKLKTMYR